MRGFSAKVDQGTSADKTAQLELENGEVVAVYDGKRRLEGADGERYRFKCVVSVDSMAVERGQNQIDESDGIRRGDENSLTVLVVGEVTNNDAREEWMNSQGKTLTEIDTGMGRVALKQNGGTVVNDYRVKEGDRVKAFCNRFTIIDIER